MARIENLEKTFVMPENQSWFNNCHASTLVRAGDDLLCAFMAGEREAAPDMSIWLARMDGNGWSDPVRVKSVYRLPHWNPVLHRDGERLYLFYMVGPSVPLWYAMVAESDDWGRTWSPSREAVPGDHTPRVTSRNKLLVARDGRWFGPCSVETEKYWDSYVDVSVDKGATWETHPIPINHDVEKLVGGGEWTGLGEGALWENELSTVLAWDGIIQPTLWESEAGFFHALMRSTRGRIYRSDSDDGGRTWCSAYPTDLPNNNSGIDLVRLDNGVLVLVCNPVPGNWTSRSPLSVFLSDDNGRTFGERVDLETRDGEYSYPAVVADGNVADVSYTHNRRTIVHCRFSIV